MRFRSLLVTVAALLVLLAGGCGDDDSSTSKDSKRDASSDSRDDDAASKAPTLETVLECMKGEGLDASDQSDSTSERIGVDYSEGRLLVYFEKSEDDAEMTASISESQFPDDTVEQVGSVVITAPEGDEPGDGVEAAVGCVEGS